VRSTLHEALAALGNLDTYVKSIGPVNTALAAIADPVVQGYLTVRRQLDSAAFVVVLYAAFEKFVEDLIWSHTELEVAAVRYDDLLEPLREKHLAQSASLLAKGNLGEGRYANLTPAAAIANLHQCISGGQPYRLNQHAVIHHENNLRPTVVKELLRLVGASGVDELVRHTRPMRAWSERVTGVPGPAQQGSIERRLDEIVKLRNQVAHTGVGAGQVLGSGEMQEHLDFMSEYCRGLYDVVVATYLERFYVSKAGASTALGDFLEGPYDKAGGAVVVRKPSCRTYVGQPVIGKREGRVERWGTIQDMQVNSKPVSAVDVGDPVADIGLRVDWPLTKGTHLYLLPAKDDAVWP